MEDHMVKDESSLVINLSKGNIISFNTLYYEYSGRIYSFALGYLKSKVEAEEVVQEVFTKIWEKRAELKEGLSFKSYLFTITFNMIKKHFRTKALILKYLKSETKDDVDLQTSQSVTYDSLYQYITELVNQLPDRRKIIFIKSRFDELSIKEIAEELGISHKTVENQLTIALKFIRNSINKENLPAILFLSLFIS
jgi:RNA polymerase sigma-70 factor (ECF subfamily)